MDNYDVLIIGAGLAGLTAGIHLGKVGLKVKIVEKHRFPTHKVCGEYISNEVLPYMRWLDADPETLNPATITKLHFSTNSGRSFTAQLPQGGFGVSRFALDNFLYQKAMANGCSFTFSTVNEVNFTDSIFTITTTDDENFTSGIVLGAFGKRSNIDKSLERPFSNKKSDWLAVKAHYQLDFPDDTVGLYNFEGGYCGVSKVEAGKVNICYLADYKSFSKFKNPGLFQTNVLSKNPELNDIFKRAMPLFEKPLTISQISFDKKDAVENHILMIGDSAGLIHPLCGNGMAMAIHSGKIASELVWNFYKGQISRSQLEATYENQWRSNFSSRLRAGRILASGMQNQVITNAIVGGLMLFPSLLPQIIKQTHGKPIHLN